MEIEWSCIGGGYQGCDGEGVEQNRVVGDPSVIWYLTAEQSSNSESRVEWSSDWWK